MPGLIRDLFVFLHGELVGRLVRQRRGAVHLYYDTDLSPPLTPLSLSLPVGRRARHVVSDWIDGLLPENPRTRARWARELTVASVALYGTHIPGLTSPGMDALTWGFV